MHSSVAASIELDQTDPAFGEQITFTYSPDPAPGNITLEVWQNGVLVSSESHGANAEAWSYHLPFTLGPTYLYQGGPAVAAATLSMIVHGHKPENVAEVTFPVSG